MFCASFTGLNSKNQPFSPVQFRRAVFKIKASELRTLAKYLSIDKTSNITQCALWCDKLISPSQQPIPHIRIQLEDIPIQQQSSMPGCRYSIITFPTKMDLLHMSRLRSPTLHESEKKNAHAALRVGVAHQDLPTSQAGRAQGHLRRTLRRPGDFRTLLGAPGIATRSKDATRNKCIASSNKCLTSSNKKLLETRASPTRNKKLLGAPGIATRSGTRTWDARQLARHGSE